MTATVDTKVMEGRLAMAIPHKVAIADLVPAADIVKHRNHMSANLTTVCVGINYIGSSLFNTVQT